MEGIVAAAGGVEGESFVGCWAAAVPATRAKADPSSTTGNALIVKR